MSVSIVFAGIVVLVIRIGRRHSLDPFINIFEQTVFPIVDENARCDVHCGHEDKPLAQSSLAQKVLNIIGDADILSAFLRIKPEILRVRTQTF